MTPLSERRRGCSVRGVSLLGVDHRRAVQAQSPARSRGGSTVACWAGSCWPWRWPPSRSLSRHPGGRWLRRSPCWAVRRAGLGTVVQPGDAGASRLALSEADAGELRRIARRTRRYFEVLRRRRTTCCRRTTYRRAPGKSWRTGPPRPISACTCCPPWPRTTLAGGDDRNGGAGRVRFDSLRRLSRHRGHFFNWYDTRDLRRSRRPTCRQSTAAIWPAISSCSPTRARVWARMPPPRRRRSESREGMLDSVTLAHEALGSLLQAGSEQGREVEALLNEIGG